jgi:ABC-2 type transport system ATP-binding protein
MNIIELNNLSRNFGNTTAVDKVSFQVSEGEIFGFLGPNGAGKTTTINMLCTLLTPTGGKASVCGFDVLKERKQVRRCIGLVFQEPTLDEYLTAEQNLKFHAYAYGVPGHVAEKRMEELLKLVELWDRRKNKTSTYSGGMKRRLELARGLLHHPRVLFLDEPTLGLDPQTRNLIWNHIRSLREQEKRTIFMTTHYMDEAENCDRIAVIDYGKIIALDTPAKLKDSVGGDIVTIQTADNQKAIVEINEKYHLTATQQNGSVVFSVPHSDTFLPDFIRGFQNRLLSISIHRPTLDDVFLKLTGRVIREQTVDGREQFRNMMRMHG